VFQFLRQEHPEQLERLEHCSPAKGLHSALSVSDFSALLYPENHLISLINGSDKLKNPYIALPTLAIC
jgi:hypothetical protein